MAKVNLSSLDKVLPNLKAGKGSKKRHITEHQRNDSVSKAMADCDSASEIATLGMKFGLTEQEVRARAKSAPNFGQYRMVIGNRVRGVANKIRKAKQKGDKLTLSDAAYPKGNTAKKVAKKTTKKAKKSAKKKK